MKVIKLSRFKVNFGFWQSDEKILEIFQAKFVRQFPQFSFQLTQIDFQNLNSFDDEKRGNFYWEVEEVCEFSNWKFFPSLTINLLQV